jgi:hypothetical protein
LDLKHKVEARLFPIPAMPRDDGDLGDLGNPTPLSF